MKTADTWLRENYHEFVIHCNATGRKISFFTEMLESFASQQSDRREELKGIVKWMCDENISRFCDPDRIVEEYFKSHPEPAKVTDEMIERWALEKCPVCKILETEDDINADIREDFIEAMLWVRDGR